MTVILLAGAACSSSGGVDDSDSVADDPSVTEAATVGAESTTIDPPAVSTAPSSSVPSSNVPSISDPSSTESSSTGPASSDVTASEPDTGASAPIETPAAQEFELLTYNVAGLPAALSGSEPDVNTAIIGPRLNEYDIVVLQESWLTPDPPPEGLRTYHEVLVEASDHEFASESLAAPLGSDPDRPSAVLSDGLNRFSDFPLGPIERNRWTTCGDAAADCLSLKGFSVSTVDVEGFEILVYDLHLDAGREDSAIRDDNVAELIAHIGQNADGRAIVVAGDFNLHLDRDPDAGQFARLLAETGLSDVCTELGCSEPNRIDKILFRSSSSVEITPLEWRNESAVFTRDDGEPLSDHDPIAARFEIDGS